MIHPGYSGPLVAIMPPCHGVNDCICITSLSHPTTGRKVFKNRYSSHQKWRNHGFDTQYNDQKRLRHSLRHSFFQGNHKIRGERQMYFKARPESIINIKVRGGLLNCSWGASAVFS